MNTFAQTLIQTLQDRNSQGSGKRLAGYTIILTIVASVVCFYATGKALPEYMYLGLISLAAGLYGVTLFERQNKTTEQMMVDKPTDNETKIKISENENTTPAV